MIKQATKQPVTIDYLEWDGTNADEVEEFIGDAYSSWIPSKEQIEILTLEGPLFASKGDLIIKGVKGEFYPCKPDIFAQTYGEPEKPYAWRLVKWQGESAATLELSQELTEGMSKAMLTVLTHQIGETLVKLGMQFVQGTIGDPDDDDFYDGEDD